MQGKASIYIAELLLRGFSAWEDETVADELDERFAPSLAPAFLCMNLKRLEITFAYDKNLVLWAAVGTIDLTDLGFTELVFAEDELKRVLH